MNSLNSTVELIKNAISKHTSFLVTVHEHPDGDALGSQLALYLFLKKLGKDVVAWNKDPVSEIYKFLPASSEIECIGNENPEKNFDVIFVLDVGEPKRTGFTIPSFSGELINIDHHTKVPMFGTINCVDASACATSEIVYQIIKGSGDYLDFDIALNLYVGIFTDTGSFRFNNTSKNAFSIAAHLLDYGVQPHIVAEKIYYSVPAARLKLLSKCLNTLDISGEIASISVMLNDYPQGESSIETEDFINFPRSLSSALVAILFKEIEENVYKVSLRSKRTVDIAIVARKFDGGGHKNAAGFKISGSLPEIKKLVFEAVKEII